MRTSTNPDFHLLRRKYRPKSQFIEVFRPSSVIARAFMPVAIRSLNGYYGFLDSLRLLEMTTVKE